MRQASSHFFVFNLADNSSIRIYDHPSVWAHLPTGVMVMELALRTRRRFKPGVQDEQGRLD